MNLARSLAWRKAIENTAQWRPEVGTLFVLARPLEPDELGELGELGAWGTPNQAAALALVREGRAQVLAARPPTETRWAQRVVSGRCSPLAACCLLFAEAKHAQSRQHSIKCRPKLAGKSSPADRQTERCNITVTLVCLAR